MTVRILLLITLLLLLAPLASGYTWRVEKDGSGDFVVIQDALDVSAPGDSILVGSGRFDDFHIYTSPQLGGTVAAIMVPSTGPLTVVGTGQDSTIVGPESLVTTYMGFEADGLMHDAEPPNLTVVGVGFENCAWPVTLRGASTFQACRFSGGTTGIVALRNATGATFADCEFLGPVPDGGPWAIVSFVGGVNDSLKISDSLFKWGRGINLYGCDGFKATDVRFEDVETPYLLDHVSGSVTRSIAISPDVRGMELHDCTLTLSHCWFGEGGSPTVYAANYNDVTADFCQFGGSDTYTLEIQGNYRFTNCNIEKGAGLTIRGPFFTGPVLPILNFEDNWWGSSDSTEIASWILDGLDGGIPERSLIDFVPFRTEPVVVPTAQRSLGQLKGLFRGPGE